MAKTTTWTGAAGDYAWYNPLNWTGGVPSPSENTIFKDGHGWFLRLDAKTGDPAEAVGTLDVVGDTVTLYNGELDFKPVSPASGPTLDLTLDKGAALTVAAGGRLVGGDTMELGRDGSATEFTLFGTISQEYALVWGGALTIEATGHWISGMSGIEVGGSGNGALVVAYGGTIDGGPDGFKNPAARLQIGDDSGSGTAQILGAGTSVTLTSVFVGAASFDGGGGSGTLTISGGAHVTDEVGVIAASGDGYVTVTGQGSRWNNLSSLSFGQAIPTDSSLTVTHHGEVDWGSGFFVLDDTLNLDGTAILHGATIIDGGQIIALGGGGNVTLSAAIDIATNWLFSNRELASVGSLGGVSVSLTGKISGDAASVLYAGVGHVVVTGSHNAYGATQIYGATVEAGAAGALGSGSIAFVGGTKAAEIEIDAGVKLANAIKGFGAADAVDLRGFAFTSTIHETWAASKGGVGGTLTLTAGTATQSLHFADTFTATSFVFSTDGGGGTMLRLAAPHA